MPNYKHLSTAQRDHLAQLIAEMKATEQAAQRFLRYLAAEHEVVMGADGWLFDVENLRFVQDVAKATVTNGVPADCVPIEEM
jgi:hypothetical protein